MDYLITLNYTALKFLPYCTIDTTKPLFIYLPGMDGSGELLVAQTEIWENFDVRCVYIPPEKLGWQELTDKLVSLIKEELILDGERKIYLCGESFGACLALKSIEFIPHLIDQVILINSASGFKQRPILNLGTYITAIMSDFIYQNSTLLLLPFLAKLEAITKEKVNKLLQLMQEVPPKIVSWRLSLLQNFQYEPPQSHPRLLIIASAEDKLLPSVLEAKKLKQMFPDSEMTILPESGHCCLLEQKVDLYKIINTEKISAQLNLC